MKNISELPVAFQLKYKCLCSSLTHLSCLPYQTLFLSFIEKLLCEGQAKPATPGIPLPISPGSLLIFHSALSHTGKNFAVLLTIHISQFLQDHMPFQLKVSELMPLIAEFFHLYALQVFAFSSHFIHVLHIALLQKMYSIFVCPSGFNKLFEVR